MLTLPEPILPVLILFATLFRGPTWRKAQVLLVSAILAPGQRIDHLAHIDPQALAKLQGVKVLWVNGENGGPHKWAVGTTFEWEFDFPVTTNPAYEAKPAPKPESTDGRREGRANWDEGAYKGESLGSIGTDVTPQRVFSSRTGPRERSMEAGNRVIVRPDATGCTRGPGGREFGCGGSVADSAVRLGVGWLAVGPGREWPAQPRASPGEDAK